MGLLICFNCFDENRDSYLFCFKKMFLSNGRIFASNDKLSLKPVNWVGQLKKMLFPNGSILASNSKVSLNPMN